MLLCDMAHFAGLVAAGLHPNPVPHCDFVTSTTHKTLSGPRSGFVLCREEHAQALDRAVFPGMQGGPMEHVIAAKATCFRIAATPAFREYQSQIRANADALADELQAGGLDVLTGGTDTHLLQLDLREHRVDGQGRGGAACRGPDHRQPQHRAVRRAPPTVASGVRMGTPACTMRGFDEDDFREVGRIVCGALSDEPDVAGLAAAAGALRDAAALPGLPRLDDLRG